MQQKTTLYLPPDLHRRLVEAARREKRSQADLVREALDRYLNGQPARRPRSVGSVSDGTLDARNAKQWVREQWAKKWASR
ncbi:MAG TPA: CopG family transcriptional regulator [Acidimicrobiia bacterium]|nr:CopG family transcriptional regulator [Acidimicrobiia bacterium]